MKIAKIGGALLLCSAVLVSCHKTVTRKKLDGKWKMTSATITSTNNSTSTTTTSDGTTMTTNDNGDISTSTSTTNYTFDKKEGTFETIQVSNETQTNTVMYYTKTGSSYSLAGGYEQTDVRDITDTEKGTYTITGGTGEIEKNSQIVLITTSNSNVINHKYSYTDIYDDAVTDFSGKYLQVYVNGTATYVAMAATGTTTNSTTGTNLDQMVWTATSLKKGKLDIEYTHDETSGSSVYKYSAKMTLTEEK